MEATAAHSPFDMPMRMPALDTACDAALLGVIYHARIFAIDWLTADTVAAIHKQSCNRQPYLLTAAIANRVGHNLGK